MTTKKPRFILRRTGFITLLSMIVILSGCKTSLTAQDVMHDSAANASDICSTQDALNTDASSHQSVSEPAESSVTDTSLTPQKADTPYSYLIQNAPTLKKDSVVSYDFSSVAWKYMTEIATLFPNRNTSFGSRPGGFPPELLGPSTHDDAAMYIFRELKAHGYVDLFDKEAAVLNAAPAQYPDATVSAPALSQAAFPLQEICNITACLPGVDSSKQIIVGAHYDGDGAGDNASGCALLLAVACGLKEHGVTPPVDLVFIFFDAEEIGFLGSKDYVDQLTNEEIASTLFMVNIDSIAFGDYCNIFGGRLDESALPAKSVIGLNAYKHAVDVADRFEIDTCLTADLDGYFADHDTGPAISDTTLFTNPWTDNNPPPKNYNYPSPMTGPWSDHEACSAKGIDIIYFEASNMFAVGDGRYDCYSGYYETYNDSIGYYGMFMNTEYDTLTNLETYFPGRGRAHLSLFSRLLTALLQTPYS